MRWPFTNLFRGAAAREDASSAGIETASPGADEPADPGPAGESRPAAWRDLPPVQRAVGAAPVTAPSTAFARGLAGRRVPDPMLAPLAHDMMADGPAGLVSGLAVPLVPRAPSVSDPRSAADLPAPAADRMRPRPRGTVSTAAASPRLAGREDAAADTNDQGAAAVPGDMATAGGPESGLPTIAQRVLPVARMAASGPAASGPAAPALAIAATRVGEATAPAPIVARAVPLVPATAGSAIAPGASELPASTTAPDGTGLASGPVGERAADTGPGARGWGRSRARDHRQANPGRVPPPWPGGAAGGDPADGCTDEGTCGPARGAARLPGVGAARSGVRGAGGPAPRGRRRGDAGAASAARGRAPAAVGYGLWVGDGSCGLRT